jgi:hypothetical protein
MRCSEITSDLRNSGHGSGHPRRSCPQARPRLVKRPREQLDTFGQASCMQTPVPGGNDDAVLWEQERRRKMKSVQAPEPSLDREPRCAFDQPLVNLDDGECRPLSLEGARRCPTTRQRERTRNLDESDTRYEPLVGVIHRVSNQVTAGLGHVALDECAGVQIEAQRSASRSESTSAEALRRALTRRGALEGRTRDGGATRPSATSSRRGSSICDAPAGTMSAMARPRTVTRTCWPRPTARSVSLSDCFSSRTPTSRIWTLYQACDHFARERGS